MSKNPAAYDDVVTIMRVKPTNLHRRMLVIHDLLPMFGFVSGEMTFELEAPLRLESDLYQIMRVDVARVGRARVEIAISDVHSWPSYDKVWVFDLNSEATCVIGHPAPNKRVQMLPGGCWQSCYPSRSHLEPSDDMSVLWNRSVHVTRQHTDDDAPPR